MITDIDIFEAATNYGCIVGTVEFDEWMKAHDAEVRNEPPELTAKEHLEAAFEAAHPVPKGLDVPAGVPIITRWDDGEIRVHAMGSTAKNRGTNDYIEARTLEPLPPVIPDDCNAVWAGNEWLPDGVRALWVRESDVLWRHIVTQAEAQKWCDGTLAFDVLTAVSDELINPVPVPSESEATK